MLIISLVFLLSFLFISNCENNTQITEPNQQSLGSINQPLDELEKGVNNLTKSVEDGGKDPKYCGNAEFPKSTEITHNMTYIECQGGKDKNVTATFVAHLWANYVPKYQLLYWLACGKPQNPGIPTLTISKSQQNNHPYITWGFKYSHYYRVQKKINNDSWTVLPLIDNCWEGDDCGDNDDYEDTSVSLSNIENNYSYRVALKMFTSDCGANSNEVTYKPPPVTVYISGPTNLTSGQSGTFTANASNGVPSTYTYSWSKFQYCNDRSQSSDSKTDDGSRSVPCGFWESISGNTSTVYVSGSFPEFQLKVTVTDQNGSATDYHFVDVILP